MSLKSVRCAVSGRLSKTGEHGDVLLGRKAQRIEWRGAKVMDELTRDTGFQ